MRNLGRKLKVILLMAALVGAFVLPRSVHAADPDLPIILDEAHGLQCLLTPSATTTADCDMLVIVSYELPKDDWRNSLYMEETTCVDSDENNLLDLCYTSILTSMVEHSFYDGAQASATLQGLRTAPRVGRGISGIYIAAGHSLTFGDTNYETCMEPNATIFTPATPNCLTLEWHTVTDDDGDGIVGDDAKTTNASVLKDLAADLENAIPGRTNFITSDGLIAPVGAVFFTEAFTNIVAGAPDAFALSQSQIEAVGSNTSATALESDITTDANNSALTQAVSDFATNRAGGVNLRVIGGALTGFIAGGVLLILLLIVPNGIFLALIAAVLVVWIGVQQDFVEASLVLTISLIMFGVGMFKWTRDNLA